MGFVAVTGRIIETDADVQEGAEFLISVCPKLAQAFEITKPLPLRRKPDGFDQLLSAIVSQQVSTASASAIWDRMKAARLTSADNVRQATEDDLRDVGLSRQKIRYSIALAQADLDYAELRYAPTDEVIKTLTKVPGIGVWTAEVYAMFSLGRADVFAPGDLALQEAAKVLYDLPERPKDRAFRELAEAWAPWRSVAARILWAYYRVVKNREGVR